LKLRFKSRKKNILNTVHTDSFEVQPLVINDLSRELILDELGDDRSWLSVTLIYCPFCDQGLVCPL
jgi:hypothetical protein